MGINKPVRIAITGPESTGKSELCISLSKYFNEPFVDEYSREFLAKTGGAYNYYDILKIAEGQYQKETDLLSTAPNYLFCDTDFLVTHIWAKVRYGKSHQWIEKMIRQESYDFTLLCQVDLPWEYDPLRENPQNRDYLFNLFKDELIKLDYPFGIVTGTGSERLQNAIRLLKSKGFVPIVNA